MRQGLTLETARFDKDIRACHGMLREMDLVERSGLTKNVALSRSSPSSEPPVWLQDVHERRRQRTVRLVELSIAPLAGW